MRGSLVAEQLAFVPSHDPLHPQVNLLVPVVIEVGVPLEQRAVIAESSQ
jgi:hypothetical protein